MILYYLLRTINNIKIDILQLEGKVNVISCLTQDNLILVGDGTWRNINEVRVGKMVFSYKAKKLVKRRAEAVTPQGRLKVYKIRTAQHEFWLLRDVLF